jgi:dTDP-4-amino-4,6-dideoxygalactose transaminase
VFVDVDEFYNIDPGLIDARITPRTKAVLPVHLYGQPARMDLVRKCCDRHGLLLVEDCAQAHFARYGEQLIGSFGNAGTFSFYPGKNLGAYGDAGAIVTNDAALADRCRMFANHGALRKHEHEMEGVNSRLDGMQAALLSAKLRHIHAWTERRRAAARLYDELLADLQEVVTPVVASAATHVYHLYVIRVEEREDLIRYLARHGIQTAIHYPRALPFLPAYRHMEHRPEDFPLAHRNQSRIVSLPMYPELDPTMIEYVCGAVRSFYRS